MRLEHRKLTWTLMLLFLAGVLCNKWRVEYQQQQICAVKSSSVVLPCSFNHPDGLTVKRVMWGHIKSHRHTGRFIYSSNSRKVGTRFQYIGDKHHNCSLKIHQVQHNDSGKYIFRFQTNSQTGRWTGAKGSTLQIVALKAVLTNGNRTMKEGDSVNLTCINSCDGGDLSSAFTWFKNGEPLTEGPVLYLSNISSTHSGNYTCSLTTHTRTTSGVISIDVEYGPKNTSVSVRPSTEVGAGSNVALICSSRANPPVENYTWFKMADDHTVDVGHLPVFFTGESGQYFCSVANKHGSQNSTAVTLKIQPYWATFTRDVLIIAATLLTVTAVIVLRRLNKNRTWAPETDCEEDTQSSYYVNWFYRDNNRPQEENRRAGGVTELVYASVYFHTTRESDTQQQVDSHNDGDVIYSTVCRRQHLYPPHTEP